jgi:hypothetical protein
VLRWWGLKILKPHPDLPIYRPLAALPTNLATSP